MALQLKRARPDTSVMVVEKRAGPAREAAFKVGESTVEVSSHYFAEVLGLRDHMEQEQNPKYGLRFLLPSADNEDVTRRFEFSTAHGTPGVKSYQLDRGRFENELGRRAAAAGVDLIGGARVEDVRLGEDGGEHEVELERDGERHGVRARWVVDATGRASLLKRKLGLERDSGHHINSSWWRLDGGLDFEEWGSHDRAWMGRMPEAGRRKFSTNHLLGKGYWVWLIPLASGPFAIDQVRTVEFRRDQPAPWTKWAMRYSSVLETFGGSAGFLREEEPADWPTPGRTDVDAFLVSTDNALE